ncbi:hypothetical protein BGZ93_001287 [Podila epicladia]|nr:hypothetical protein BGZ93_001287 [Podila epicladia]
MSGSNLECVTSNKDAVYGLSTRFIEDSRHVVLIRSFSNPAAIFNAPWEVIAVSSPEDLDSDDENLFGTRAIEECSVDNEGNFYLWVRRNKYYDIFKFARTSNSKISPSNRCTKNNPRYGQWSKTTISLPGNVMYKRGMSVQDPSNTTGEATVVFHPYIEEALPPTKPPTILYAPTQNLHMSSESMKSIVLTNTNAAIFNMVYGDNQMFALLKSRVPLPLLDDPTSRDTNRITYNQTLTYFPFPPNNLTNTTDTVSVPWNVTCGDSDYWDMNKARGSKSKKLYIYDSRTSKTEFAWLKDTYNQFDVFTLAYGKASQTDPQFAVMFGSPSFVIDLLTLNQTDGPSVEDSPYTLRTGIDFVGDICDRSGELNTLEWLGISIGTLVALVVLGRILFRWRRKRNAAKLAAEEGIVGGLPVYDDEEISGERHIELAGIPRISEGHRSVEDEAPPVYAPRT